MGFARGWSNFYLRGANNVLFADVGCMVGTIGRRGGVWVVLLLRGSFEQCAGSRLFGPIALYWAEWVLLRQYGRAFLII